MEFKHGGFSKCIWKINPPCVCVCAYMYGSFIENYYVLCNKRQHDVQKSNKGCKHGDVIKFRNNYLHRYQILCV